MVTHLTDDQIKDVDANRYFYHLTLFKETIEALYEICRVSRNIYGCKEILLYLTNSTRDFQTLIDSFNVEEVWENAEKPKSIAWEIKGASSGKSRIKETTTQETGEASHKIMTEEQNEDKVLEWHVVKSRTKRRKSHSSNDGGSDDGIPPNRSRKKQSASVYDRLASGQRNPRTPAQNPPTVDEFKGNGITTGKLMCPKSAMDLPQTKASMAKIAYSRQLLWQGHKQQLVEKLHAKRRQERILANLGNRRNSMPSLSNAIKKSSENLVLTSELKGVEIELASIHETDENRKEDLENIDNLSTHTLAGNYTTRSDPPGLQWDLRELDDELSSLAQEEESLAEELSSLAQEIEKEESLSIDDELQRQVSLDFEDENLEISTNSFLSSVPAGRKASWREVVAKWAFKTDEQTANQSTQTETTVTTTPTPNPEPTHRKPGDAAQMHEKLSSPSRKRMHDDLEKRNEERQTKAEEIRFKLQEEKANRLKELHRRVEEVRQKQCELTKRKALLMETKMQKAEQIRHKNLEEKIKKAKDEEQKMIEINFINTLNEANTKFELQLREQDREQRLSMLAEERARRLEEKAAKEAAALDRRQAAEQQRAEKLKEQTIKQKERQEQAEAQRSELLEAVKKKQREREMRIEGRKASEQAEQAKMSQSLLEKIQHKQEGSSRRYEENIEQVRLKAIELCSPRLLNPWISLADCHPMPSDTLYNQQRDSGLGSFSRRKCICCNKEMKSDLHLIEHLCSESHLHVRGSTLSDVDYELLKKELDTSIKEAENESTSSSVGEKPTKASSKEVLKKRRLKIRHKFTRKKFIADQLWKALETIQLDKTIEKRTNEILGVLKENSKCNENHRMAFERNIVDLHKLFLKENRDIRQKAAIYFWHSGLIEQLITYLFNSHNSKTDSSVSMTRLLGKVIHFVMDALIESLPLSVGVFSSQFVMQVCDLLLLKTKSFLDSNASKNFSKFWFTEANLLCHFLLRWFSQVLSDESAQVGEHMALTLSYLIVNGFSNYCEIAIVAILDDLALMEIDEPKLNCFDVLFGLISVLIKGVSAFLSKRNSDENGIINDCCDLVSLVVPCIICRYVHFRTEMDYDSSWRIIDNQVLTLWNFLNENKICHPIVTHILSSEERVVSIRVAFLFSNLVSYFVKQLPQESAQNLLNKTIIAVGYYASFSEQTRLFCTLGWQRSLLMNLCTLPFDYFSSGELRELLLPTLIAILLNNLTAVEVIKDELSCSWMVSFIKDLEKHEPNDKKRISLLLPENTRNQALEFFASLP